MRLPTLSSTVPGNIRLELDDDDDVPHPIVKQFYGNNSNDNRVNVEDEVVIEDIDTDEEEIPDEALPKGCGTVCKSLLITTTLTSQISATNTLIKKI